MAEYSEYDAAFEGKKSPRFGCHNVLYWFFGNTFVLRWTINLLDGGSPVVFVPTDIITFDFFNAAGAKIEHFEFSNIGADNQVSLQFNSVKSKKFKVGHYTYCIKYYYEYDAEQQLNTEVTTICDNGQIEVEACH